MNRTRLALAIGFILLLGAVPSFAAERLGIGVKVGTLGLGVDVTGRISNWFSLRGTANGYDTTESFDEEGIEYDGDVTLGAYGLFADFHPFKGQFRLTAGFLKNKNAVDLEAIPTQNIDIGDGTYTPAQVGTLTGDVAFDDSAPYFGVGYGCAARGPGRIRFVLDVGVMKQGAGDVTLSSSSGLVSQSDLQKEEQQIEDDISDYKYWPVVAFGISFRL